MNIQERTEEVINKLKKYNVSDIKFSSVNNASIKEYEEVIHTLQQMENEFPSIEEVKKKLKA